MKLKTYTSTSNVSANFALLPPTSGIPLLNYLANATAVPVMTVTSS